MQGNVSAKLLCLVALTWTLAASAQAVETRHVERSGALLRQCHSHQVDRDEAKDRTGLDVNEVFGREAAASESIRSSKGVEKAGRGWPASSRDILHASLEPPRALIHGARLSFPEILDPGAHTDLLTNPRTLSADPQVVPESPSSTKPVKHDLDPAILAISGDPAYGEYLSAECLTCHQASGADQGMPSITGWPSETFVIVMHAYKNKVRSHPVMQMMAGRLSNEEIAALAAYFESVER